MEVKVDHTFSQEEALAKMKSFLGKLKEEYGDKVDDIEEKWDGNAGNYSCKFQGMKLEGKIKVTDGNVVVNGKVPFFALPFSSVIESTIKGELDKVLKEK